MNGPSDPNLPRPTPPADAALAGDVSRTPRILVVNADRGVAALIEEWLGACGYAVESCNDCTPCPGSNGRFALVIVDIPTPRHGANERIQRIACDHPGTPVIALSSQFFPGVERTGGVARALGVASVLAKPLSRDHLVNAVQSLVRS